ncbi:uncharacterized protein EV154DRAFT_485721 [Mucor mucedo]|uniref:uncharacterized protein n=1 Tax=Mucor mucedo TaxID=29922 RepID=UPI002220A28C|nr:uncharacterized protein EV154DRAFT_485721 [Mucor mucedo]KAI7881728.1 hypothetical protein EV154DRAFT_485721 [Mucor mucedo]
MPTIYIKVKPARFTDYVLQDMIVTIFISALPLARESMFLIGFLDSKTANKQCIISALCGSLVIPFKTKRRLFMYRFISCMILNCSLFSVLFILGNWTGVSKKNFRTAL